MSNIFPRCCRRCRKCCSTPHDRDVQLFIAILLNQKFHGRTAVRAIFFLPVIIANGVIISIMNGDVFSDAVMSNASSSSLFETGGFMYMLLYETGINMTLINSVTAASWIACSN